MKNRSYRQYWIAICLAVILSVLEYSSFGFSINHSWTDFLSRSLAPDHSPTSELLVVDIDDQSLSEMESVVGKWPWPRSVHGFLLEGLKDYQPKAIVFDVLFAERDLYRPDADQFFNEAIASSSNVYLAGSMASSKTHSPVMLRDVEDGLQLVKGKAANPDATVALTLPWVVEQQYWRVGGITFDADPDGVGRFYDVRRDLDGWLWLSLPARVAKDLGVALPRENRIRLRWLGTELMPFNSVSYSDVFSHLSHPEAQTNDSLFRNKIIIIGSTATGLYDTRLTPISSHYPAVSILSTALDNLLLDRYYRTLDAVWFKLATPLLVISIVLLGYASSHYRTIFLIHWPILTLAIGSVLLISYYWAKSGWLVYVAYPLSAGAIALLVVTLVRGFAEYVQRQKLIGLFSRFMDPRVVNQLLDDQQLEVSTRSQYCRITVLFSDIRGFTTLSEQHSANEIVDLLNHYFSLQVETIFKYGGTLDKFIGDAIMAFWGAPVHDDSQADNAVRAAREMLENLHEFRKGLPQSMQNFDMGIGLHTGRAVVGMIGSEKRYDYTAIGDTVNLASRIEGLTKDRARILVSEDCKNACQTEFSWIEMGAFDVKGRDKKVQTFCLKGSQL